MSGGKGTWKRCCADKLLDAENGSGGFMSDLTFKGGAFGIYESIAQRDTFRHEVLLANYPSYVRWRDPTVHCYADAVHELRDRYQTHLGLGLGTFPHDSTQYSTLSLTLYP